MRKALARLRALMGLSMVAERRAPPKKADSEQVLRMVANAVATTEEGEAYIVKAVARYRASGDLSSCAAQADYGAWALAYKLDDQVR